MFGKWGIQKVNSEAGVVGGYVLNLSTLGVEAGIPGQPWLPETLAPPLPPLPPPPLINTKQQQQKGKFN